MHFRLFLFLLNWLTIYKSPTFCRLGFLVDFLSHAALVGFMAGAAIMIGLQQLKGLLGINHFTNKTDAVSVLGSVYKSLHLQITSSAEKVSLSKEFVLVSLLCLVLLVTYLTYKKLHGQWYPMNFVLGCSFLIFLLVSRFIVSNEISNISTFDNNTISAWCLRYLLILNFQGRRNKKLFWLPAIAPLVSVILSTLIVYLTKADKHGVNIIKHVKGGLNPSSAHLLQFQGPHVGKTAKIGLISAIIALTVC